MYIYPGCYCHKFFYDFGVDCLSLDILHVTIWYVYARLNQMHQSFWILYLVGIFFVNMNTTTYLHYLFLLEISATLEMNHNVAVWKFLLHTYITRFLYINYMYEFEFKVGTITPYRFYRMNLKSGKHLWLPEKSFFPGHHKQHVFFFFVMMKSMISPLSLLK